MKLRVGFFQFNPVYKGLEANKKIILERISNINNAILVLPELCLSGYNFVEKSDLLDNSLKINDDFFYEVSKICKNNELYVTIGYAENFEGNLYNSAVIIGKNGIVGNYRKIHLFYKEKLVFKIGDLGFNVFNIEGIDVGMMICFDWFFPEAMRTLALKGAILILHPANLVMPYCPGAMPYRCLENRVFAITANRIGSEYYNGEKYEFIGKSQVVSPEFKVLISADENEEILKLVEIDVSLAKNKNINDLNNIFNDRMPDFYKL